MIEALINRALYLFALLLLKVVRSIRFLLNECICAHVNKLKS